MVWGIVLICIIVIALLMARIAYRITFYSNPDEQLDIYALPEGEQYEERKDYMINLIRKMEEIPYESVSVTSQDGLKLSGRYYHVADGAPLQIQFHGYRGNSYRDICGDHKLAREAGQNTLVVDERAHGKSQGHTVTFGIKERYDCLEWVKYACERFGSDTKIILCGVSMGAATVLMASELELPENVVGIIADCPYSAPGEIIRKVSRDRGYSPRVMYPFIKLAARLLGGFDLEESSAVEAVKNAKIPMLIVHGEDDRRVPCDMSREIQQACPDLIRLETFADAGHGLSFIMDLERYRRIMNEFMKKVL